LPICRDTSDSRTAHRFIQVTCFLGLTGTNAAFLLPASIGSVCSCLPEVKQKVFNSVFVSRVREVKKSSEKCPGIRKGCTNLFYGGTLADELLKGEICLGFGLLDRGTMVSNGWEWIMDMI